MKEESLQFVVCVQVELLESPVLLHSSEGVKFDALDPLVLLLLQAVEVKNVLSAVCI